MALIPKTAVLQIRLDPDFLLRFQAFCDARNETASEVIRRMMFMRIEQHERAQKFVHPGPRKD